MARLTLILASLFLSAGICLGAEPSDPYGIVANPTMEIGSLTVRGKEQIDCAWIAQHNPIVIFAMGQSLVGNSNGTVPWELRVNRNVYEHWGTRCYKASEPLYGGGDVHRSFLFKLADLVSRATGRDVVINVAAVGGASIDRFLPNGDAYRIWTEQLSNAKRVGLVPSVVLWEHGQGNVRDDQQRYKTAVLSIFKELREKWGIDAPIFIAQDTMLEWHTYPGTIAIQREMAMLPGNTLGPNVDLIKFRMDGTHMDDQGLAIQATMWFQVLATHFKW